MTTNAVVSDRAPHEIYLKAFDLAIREAQPWTVMTSYNKINGQWVPANPKLMSVLRDEFKFNGVVISDAMAIHTEKVNSHRYDLDFEIAGLGQHVNELQSAVNSGILSEGILNQSMDRMLTLLDKLRSSKPTHPESIEENSKLARKIAAQSVVLLENDGILPLKSNAQKIAVIGALA